MSSEISTCMLAPLSEPPTCMRVPETSVEFKIKPMEFIGPDSECKAIKPRNFYQHTRPDPNTYTIGSRIYDIPLLAILIKQKEAYRYDPDDIYRLNKIVLLAAETKSNLPLYKEQAMSLLHKLADHGYGPAQLDLFDFDDTAPEINLQTIESIQNYLHAHDDCTEYNKNKYVQILRHIEDSNKCPLAGYICARSYEKGIGNMLSSPKAFEEYMKSYEQSDSDIDLKRKIVNNLYDFAINDSNRTLQLFDQLVNEEDEDFQFMACNLLIKYFSFKDDNAIDISSLEKVMHFTVDHYGIQIAKALMCEINALDLKNSDQQKCIHEYEKAIIHLNSIVGKNKDIEYWKQTIRNNLAKLYEKTNQLNKAIDLYKINIEGNCDYSKCMLALLYLNCYWKQGELIKLGNVNFNNESEKFDQIPQDLFKWAIDTLTEYAEKDEAIACRLSRLYLGSEYTPKCCNRSVCDWQKALYYAQMAEKLAIEKNKTEILYNSWYTQFTIYSKGFPKIVARDMQKAIEYLLKGANNEEDTSWQIRFINKLIQYYDDVGEYQEACQWIVKGVQQKNCLSLAYLAYYQVLGVNRESNYVPSSRTSNIPASALTFKKAFELFGQSMATQEDLDIFDKLQLKLQPRYVSYSKSNNDPKFNELLTSIVVLLQKPYALCKKEAVRYTKKAEILQAE